MNIALIAHDSKKDLMVDLCIAYKAILSKHTLCATGETGKLVMKESGLKVERLLSGNRGGDDQICSFISSGNIDLLLFIRDGDNPNSAGSKDFEILRLCDLYNIPVATNAATADALILALDRGDLDYVTYLHDDIR